MIDDKDMLEDKVYILENKLANVQCSKSTLEMWMRIQGVIEKTDTAGQLPLMAALDREFRPVDAVLVSYPREKLVPVIRLLRELYSLGLKDAKDLAESIPNAKIQESLDAQEFEILRIRFEEIGARISKRSIGSVDRVQNSEVLDLEQVKEAAEDLNSHQYGCANEDCQNSESFAGPQNCPDCGQPGCQLNN